ncbi:C-GCAxxG-C-C family (seleno)protein [Dendrosporobacter sp. 1207_IL3150]|uniref:C-GCAxxG-C-C family (seleno)protein n=1 Tax=Dendrosporobacter sp. 1207_IL3150 TaxID=3084054 RepID=UPI002FDA700F
MLYELINEGFGDKEDFNCAEKILYGANQAYNLGFSHETLKLSAGFGGGMAIGSVCGALTAAVMVLSSLYVKNNAHESTKIKALSLELFSTYRKEMGEINCGPLKARYRTEELKCRNVIATAAKVLDRIIERENGQSAPCKAVI